MASETAMRFYDAISFYQPMKKIFLFISICLFICGAVFGQSTVRGKISDNNGESAIGAIVVLKANRSVGTTTDFDGNYSLKITDSTEQTLVISLLGFQTVEETIHPRHGEVILKNFTLKPAAAKEIKEVEVTAKAVKSKEYFIENVKKKSATTMDYISSETIRKTGDANVSTAVARITGVSTTDKGFITVRGIGDRYVKTTINGSVVPTLDPFTNNLKLDLFPASLVDNIIITKTASPDLPGDWAGAYISVETKDYPEQFSVSAESTVGYNPQSTFKDVISSQRSSTDWLGYDNNFRDHSHDFVVFNGTINSVDPTPGRYYEYVALGLGPYFNSLGITAQNWTADGANGANYDRLGLVQLGLLPPALINDAAAYQNAKNQYLTGPYQTQAFDIINAPASAWGKSFPNNWNTLYRKAPMNFSQSFSIGNQIKLFKKPLGFIAGFRYGSSMQYDPVSTANRINGNIVDGHAVIASRIEQQSSVESNGWSALCNLAYKLSPNNSISFLFMPNFTGVNKVRYSNDYSEFNVDLITKSQYYEERKQLVYQLKSEHYIPAWKWKIEMNTSYTDGKSNIPDFKNLPYAKDAGAGGTITYRIGSGVGDGIHRYYRYLSDNIFDGRLSLEMPLANTPGLTRKLKVGGAYQRSDKKYDQYDYELNISGPLLNDNLDEYFSLDHFDIRSYTSAYGEKHTIDYYYYSDPEVDVANHTFGHSDIGAGFCMLDYALTSRLRFSGGLRIEQADFFTDVVKFDSLHLPANDSRRIYAESLPLANPGKLNEISYLPSASLIYKLKNDETYPVNLRLNYSQSVARPSLRELSDIAAFDYELRAPVFGNSDLKMVNISNYDLRLESYFKTNDNLSVSFFYKDFKNHIELVNPGIYTWLNAGKSYAAGVEVEGKKVLPFHFTFSANVTLIKSQTTYVKTQILTSEGRKNYFYGDEATRGMYGQAPYVVNGILSYTADSLGITATLSYNMQGPRLVIASESANILDVYEMPRNLADLKISKNISKHFIVSITVRDILNTPIVLSYKEVDVDYNRYRYGTNYLFSLSYKL